MTFTIGTLTRCPGGNHYQIPVTIGGVTKTLHLTRNDLEGEPPASAEEARVEILDRLRSAIKEAGATTLAQTRAAIETKTFKV